MITIDDAQVGHFVALAMRGMPASAPLMRCSTAQFRRCFDLYIERLKVSTTGYRPYCLRRGEATHDFRTTGGVTQNWRRDTYAL